MQHINATELGRICSPERHFTHVESKLRAVGIAV
jgi:hypothetical protein